MPDQEQQQQIVCATTVSAPGRFAADPNLEETCVEETVTGLLLQAACETPKSATSDARRRMVDVACGSSNTKPSRPVLFGDPNLEETAAEEGDDEDDTFEIVQVGGLHGFRTIHHNF